MQEPLAFNEDYEIHFDPDELEEGEEDESDDAGTDEEEDDDPVHDEEEDLEDDVFCVCRGPEGDDPMVQCTHEYCEKPAEWYHIGCLGIEELPGDHEEWMCPLCE